MILTIDPRTFKGQGNYRTTITYDFLGHMSTRTRTLGLGGGGQPATEVFVFDKVGNLKTFQDARGSFYTTSYQYDALNRLITAIAPGGAASQPGNPLTTSYTYDAGNNVTSITDPRGSYYTTLQVWDVFNRLVQVTRPGGTSNSAGTPSVWNYSYDAAGNRLSETDPRGGYYTTVRTFDELNRVKTVTQPTGTSTAAGQPSVTTYEYDAVGNLMKETHVRTGAGGGTFITAYESDALNRRTKVTDPLGYVTDTGYDAEGNVKSQTFEAAPGSAVRKTLYEYDQLNRQTKFTDAAGYITITKYDAVGNIIQVTGPYGDASGTLFTTIYVYDGGNRLRKITDADGYVTTYEYDAVANRTAVTDGRGGYYRVQYDYDAQNRVVRKSYPSGSSTAPGPQLVEQYVYDGVGNLIQDIDPRGLSFATNYDYDAQNRLVQIRTIGGSSSALVAQLEKYTYDEVGNRLTYTDPRGGGFVTQYTYDAMNRKTSATYPDGTVTSPHNTTEQFVYDSDGNMVAHTNTGGAAFTTQTPTTRMDEKSRKQMPKVMSRHGPMTGLEIRCHTRLRSEPRTTPTTRLTANSPSRMRLGRSLFAITLVRGV